MKILLTGSSGQVGHEMQRHLAGVGIVLALSRTQMDLADPDQVRDQIRRIKPAIIVNSAAYTAVDKAESELDLAMRINAASPAVMAEEAERLGAGLIHFSTDYVFDGNTEYPYTEEDQPLPLNVYGATKLAGEQAISLHCQAHWIFRTSWVYGVHGNNFLKSIMRLAQERSHLNIVGDQFGAPTSAELISATVANLVSRPQHANDQNRCLDFLRATKGIFHLTAAGSTSWHAYAKFIVEKMQEMKVPQAITADQVRSITSGEYPTAAVRPKNSTLSTKKLKKCFGIEPAPWQEGVERAVAAIVRQQTAR